ncbi:hypothetical protein BAME_26310 [Bacillus sp. M 2-6]|nr:hypothetical protein BAME_26310 [Bacillus sp. M 2-6]
MVILTNEPERGMIMANKQNVKQQEERMPKEKDMPSYAEAETKKMQYGKK